MQEEKKEETKEEKKRKQQKKVLIATIITAVVIIAGLIIAIIFLLREPPLEVVIEYDRTATGGRGMVVTEDNIEEVIEWLEEPGEDTEYEIYMSANWTFPTSSRSNGNALFRNLPSNTRMVFFELYLEDEEQVIYVSPYIPLGREVRNFALDVALPVGTYEPLMTIFLVDDDKEIVTDVQMRVQITIEN